MDNNAKARLYTCVNKSCHPRIYGDITFIIHYTPEACITHIQQMTTRTRHCRSMIYSDNPAPHHRNFNDPCDLDLWPIDLEMVLDTSSPHGLYLCHTWYNPWNRQWAMDGQTDNRRKEGVKSIYPSTISLVSEWVINLNSLFGDSGHWGPYSPYKPCNYSLYIGIIIFPHINNTQSAGYN